MILSENWAVNQMFSENAEPLTAEDLSATDKADILDEEYFGDMVFAKDSITYRYLKLDKNEEEYNMASLPEVFTNYTSAFFGCKYEGMNDKCYGAFQFNNRTIYLSNNISDKKFEDIVLLHELIHVHEWILEEEKVPLFYRDIIFMSLYLDLKDKIEDLDQRISNLSYLYSLSSIRKVGGEHGLLFLLKSFDLDLKRGYELGTVFSYKY